MLDNNINDRRLVATVLYASFMSCVMLASVASGGLIVNNARLRLSANPEERPAPINPMNLFRNLITPPLLIPSLVGGAIGLSAYKTAKLLNIRSSPIDSHPNGENTYLRDNNINEGLVIKIFLSGLMLILIGHFLLNRRT